MKSIFSVVLILLLTGCAATMNLTMMPRDSGASYRGELHGDGSGSGTMTVDFDGTKCTGPASRVSSSQSTAVGSSVGYSNGQTSSAFAAATIDGDSKVKALLTCSDGKGLRCEFTGRDAHGGGICTTDAGRVFDVIVARQ